MNEPQRTSATSPAERANHLLARSINIGLDLGGPAEAGWTISVTAHDLERCAEAGFTAIRLVVSLAQHRSPHDAFRIETASLDRVNEVVDAATAHGLAVVVANMGDPDLMADPVGHRDRLLACTRQLADSVRHHPPSVILEPLAEPQGALDPLWGDYCTDLVTVVRDADPERTIVIGPRSYNNARYLRELTLLENERNLIVTFHHYWPVPFTMQGETWLGTTELGDPANWVGTTWDASPQQSAELRAGFDAVAAYGHAHQRPIFVGEFGTTNNADMASRSRWTRVNRELAEQHGFSWAYWSYGPIFAVRDLEHDHWHQALLQALIPIHRTSTT
jgi:endoglucanase